MAVKPTGAAGGGGGVELTGTAGEGGSVDQLKQLVEGVVLRQLKQLVEGEVSNHLKQLVEVDLTWTVLCVLQHGLGHGETEMVLYSSWAGGQEVHHGDHGQVDAGENEEESADHLDDQGRRRISPKPVHSCIRSAGWPGSQSPTISQIH